MTNEQIGWSIIGLTILIILALLYNITKPKKKERATKDYQGYPLENTETKEQITKNKQFITSRINPFDIEEDVPLNNFDKYNQPYKVTEDELTDILYKHLASLPEDQREKEIAEITNLINKQNEKG